MRENPRLLESLAAVVLVGVLVVEVATAQGTSGGSDGQAPKPAAGQTQGTTQKPPVSTNPTGLQGSAGTTSQGMPQGTISQGIQAATAAAQAADFQISLKQAGDELVELAGAIPQAKYTWRPGKGVRSIAEVYLHVAAGNYSLPKLVGIQPPPDIALKGFETSTTDKEKIMQALTASFAYARGAIASVADWDTQVDIWGQKGTKRQALLELVTHAHEHLGQSIAYARVNGIVPPWTARAQAATPAPAPTSTQGTMKR